MQFKNIRTLIVTMIFVSTAFAQTDHSAKQTAAMGQGLFMGAKSGTDYMFNLELGYLWKTGENPGMALNENYIGERSDYRYGISAGVQYFKNEPVFASDVRFYRSTAYGPYLKLHFGSPVLMNFVSYTCHFKGMYTIPTGGNDHGISDKRMVFGYGYDVEFWVTESECASIGFTDESDSFFGSSIDDPIYPSKIRFVFGFKTFF